MSLGVSQYMYNNTGFWNFVYSPSDRPCKLLHGLFSKETKQTVQQFAGAVWGAVYEVSNA